MDERACEGLTLVRVILICHAVLAKRGATSNLICGLNARTSHQFGGSGVEWVKEQSKDVHQRSKLSYTRVDHSCITPVTTEASGYEYDFDIEKPE